MENQIKKGFFAELTSFKFPFIGFCEENSFEYLLISFNESHAEISTFDWMVKRADLQQNHYVDLFLPQVLSMEYRLRRNISGKITNISHQKDMQGSTYQVELTQPNKGHLFTNDLASLDANALKQLLAHLIKDSSLLKNGVQIYLNHLIPYFSRIGDYSYTEYVQLEQHFFNDLITHIRENEDKLNQLYNELTKETFQFKEIPILFNLEELRECIESESSFDVFNLMFSDKNKLKKSKDKFQIQAHQNFNMYFTAIKSLEKRLYSNYNEIVIIYSKSV